VEWDCRLFLVLFSLRVSATDSVWRQWTREFSIRVVTSRGLDSQGVWGSILDRRERVISTASTPAMRPAQRLFSECQGLWQLHICNTFIWCVMTCSLILMWVGSTAGRRFATCFKVLFWYLSGETAVSHENPTSIDNHSTEIEPATFRKKDRI
jgi:hypothetical protein